MPPVTFTIILLGVIVSAGLTIWLLSSGGPMVMAITLPAFLIATVALWRFRK